MTGNGVRGNGRDTPGIGGMYDPVQLRTFLTVAQTLSFTQAAGRLGVRQSTVSQHVRRLEEATGRPLFVRDTHSVELTEDGEALLGFARTILEAHERAAAFFAGTRLRGRLRFGASEDFVLTRLPEFLEGFRHEHPEVDLDQPCGDPGGNPDGTADVARQRHGEHGHWGGVVEVSDC